MESTYRTLFNAGYSDALYQGYVADLERRCGTPIDLQIAETPVFFPKPFRERLVRAGDEILAQLCDPARIAQMEAAVPPRWSAPGRGTLPTCCAIDFAVTLDDNGELAPKLIELQGFPTLFGYQLMQLDAWSAALARIPGLKHDWTCWFSGLDNASYIELCKKVILGDHDPDTVILMDLDPPKQKTYPDFTASTRLFGIDAVCPTTLVRRGRKLYRTNHYGRTLPVERIFNRTIVDELERKRVALPFDWRDELDVEWTPHPNWFWIWSKYSLPYLDHPAAPRARLLSQSNVRLTDNDLDGYVLKPLFSFAGAGVNVTPTARDVATIPENQRNGWCIQEKIEYGGVLRAPDGPVKVETRLLYLRPDDAPTFTLAFNLCRLSRGSMMGVDHNRGQTWVGSSIGLWAHSPSERAIA